MPRKSEYERISAVIEEEKELRIVTSRQVRLIYAIDSDELNDIFKPGTATLMLVRAGSEILSQTEHCASNPEKAAPLAALIREQYAGRSRVALKEAIQTFHKQQTICSLAGGRFSLGENLFLPDGMDLAYAVLPYNGGAIDGITFSLTQYHDPDREKIELDAILVFRSSPLSPAESAALALLPSDQLDLNVGPIAECWGLTGVAVALAVIVITIGCKVLPIVATAAISDETIARIGPERTARELVRARRLALQRTVK